MPTPVSRAKEAAPRGMSVGHVHLRVSDLDRAVQFYCQVLGLDVMQQLGGSAAFLSNDGYHHHIALNTWGSRGGTAPPDGHTGLYHVAFRYEARTDLAGAVLRVLKAGLRLTGASDHGVSEAVYLDDPDGNGIELYWDKPRHAWPIDEAGHLAMTTAPLDLEALLSEVA